MSFLDKSVKPLETIRQTSHYLHTLADASDMMGLHEKADEIRDRAYALGRAGGEIDNVIGMALSELVTQSQVSSNTTLRACIATAGLAKQQDGTLTDGAIQILKDLNAAVPSQDEE